MTLESALRDLHEQIDSLRPQLRDCLAIGERMRIGLYVTPDGVGDIQLKQLPCVDRADKTGILLLQTK